LLFARPDFSAVVKQLEYYRDQGTREDHSEVKCEVKRVKSQFDVGNPMNRPQNSNM
jgi:hypothetical protein